LFRQLNPEQIVLAGQVKETQWREAESCGLRMVDYVQREDMAVANAAATAEGAIRVAMQSMDRTLLGQECLVLGFGRIGKLLSYRLHGLGARVTATARKAEDLAWICAYGWNALETNAMDGKLGKFGVVFNTVPSLVLDGPLLEQLPAECLCIDLASVEGIDGAEAVRLGKKYIWARSLPGKLVPHTAAVAIRDTIYYIINNEL
jgi:dipicolinate synthase subunit A